MKIYKAVPIFLIFFAKSAFAGGILVDPSFVRVQGVEPGVKFELTATTESNKYFLVLTNKNDNPADFSIVFITCKEYGCEPRSGYKDVPETKWFNMKSQKISVPAGQKFYVKDVFIEVPKKKEYQNQKWQAVVKVRKNATDGEFANLQVILPLLIETKGINSNLSYQTQSIEGVTRKDHKNPSPQPSPQRGEGVSKGDPVRK